MAKTNQKHPPNRGPNRRDAFTDQSPVGYKPNKQYVRYESDGSTSLSNSAPPEESSSRLIR